MRPVIQFAACCLATSSLMAQNRSDKDALKDFQAELVGKPLILQGFSADPSTTFNWTINGLTVTPPNFRTIGIFNTTKIKLHKNAIEITGRRHTYHEDKHGQPQPTADNSALIRIDFHGAEAAQVLPTLKAQLFFSTLEAAVAAIPENDRDMFHFTGVRRQPQTSGNCANGGIPSRPKLVYAQDAEFSEEARHARFSGSVEVGFTVDEDGHPFDIWIVKGAGLSLDEQAGMAAAKYEFHPATCDGQPVKVQLFIDVAFHIF